MGRSLGSYELGKTLGKGTFGKVKLATHTPTGELVAIKVLEKSKMRSEADVCRVTREVNILKQVKHPHIAQLYQIIETPNKICLVLEYMTRGELYDLIVRHKRLREAEAAKYFFQLMCAVQHMHAQGVSHRDLKPENLLLDEKFNLKVIDFGLSNHFSGEGKLNTACGSPCYAAPEMVAGMPYSGAKVDVWSCGVVLYAMTVGKLPFDDTNSAELYRKILGGKFSCPGFLSEELRDLLNNLLKLDMDLRLTVASALSSKWLKSYAFPPPEKQFATQPVSAVLSRMRELGLDAEFTQQSLEAQKHNQLTTAYFLLVTKMTRDGMIPRLESTTRLSPRLPTKSQTTRATTASFNRHTNLVKAIKTQDESVVRTRLKIIRPQIQVQEPSVSPQRRVSRQDEIRGVTPHNPSRGRSTSKPRSQSHRRSASINRNALTAVRKSPAVQTSNVCWTSNKPYTDVVEEVQKGMNSLRFTFRPSDDGFVWEHQQVLAEVSVKRLGTLVIVKCKLLAGPAQVYRDLCSRLLCNICL